MPTFSVIIPTRNRAALFKRALESVLAQTGASYEVVVVNDGTSGAEATALDLVKADYAGVVRFVDLPVTSTGHGCFRVMNTGVLLSSGRYVCFLDDDDLWIDAEHLADAQSIVDMTDGHVDVMFFDQAAYRGDRVAEGPIWLEDLGARLRQSGGEPPYPVDPALLLTAHGFAHTNTVIARRDVFSAIGGFDTTLWYEGDRDFFLRIIDVAADIRYMPKICARHSIPADAGRVSMSNTTSALKKALDQARLLHKAASRSRDPAIRQYASRHRRYALRKAIDAAAFSPASWWKLLGALTSMTRRRPMDEQVLGVRSATGG